MIMHIFKQSLIRFRDDTRGTIMVETVIVLPLLFWMLAATYEFFEIHRYRAVREKATYTVADMFSRELREVDDVYIDNTKTLFDLMTNDDGINQIRVSILRYNQDEDENEGEYELSWSEVRGTGSLVSLSDSTVASLQNSLPAISAGSELILIDSISRYDPLFTVGISKNVPIETRVFTTIRFAPMICFDGVTCDALPTS